MSSNIDPTSAQRPVISKTAIDPQLIRVRQQPNGGVLDTSCTLEEARYGAPRFMTPNMDKVEAVAPPGARNDLRAIFSRALICQSEFRQVGTDIALIEGDEDLTNKMKAAARITQIDRARRAVDKAGGVVAGARNESIKRRRNVFTVPTDVVDAMRHREIRDAFADMSQSDRLAAIDAAMEGASTGNSDDRETLSAIAAPAPKVVRDRLLPGDPTSLLEAMANSMNPDGAWQDSWIDFAIDTAQRACDVTSAWLDAKRAAYGAPVAQDAA